MYDGDGRRVKSIFNNNATTTYFVGTHYEVTNPGANQTITKYYYAGAQRIAMRTNGTLNYLLGDHLGSTSLVTDSAGNKVNEQRYKVWGETRYIFGNEKTKYQYTGQFSYMSDFGLMFYNARWYDPTLGRFAQADTIIPPTQGVQAWDRYAYANNNPIRYIDPSGHSYCSYSSSNEDEDCQYVRENRNFHETMNYVRDEIVNNNNQLKNSLNPLDAMLMVIEKAANIYGDDWNGFLDATTYIFTGYYGHGHEAMAAAGYNNDFDGYFDGDSGFHTDFRDQSNQVRHFWAAFATAADPYGDNPVGEASADFGNWWHDVATDGFGNDGATIKDYKLSITGIDIAAQVGNEIKTPSVLTKVLLDHLGANGPGYISDAYINPHWWITPND